MVGRGEGRRREDLDCGVGVGLDWEGGYYSMKRNTSRLNG